MLIRFIRAHSALTMSSLPLLLSSIAWAQPNPSPEAPPTQNNPAADDTDPDAQLAEITLPQLTHRVQPDYPADAPSTVGPVRVELTLVVQTDGRVGQVDVTTSAGAAFDREAVRAARQWRFEPARRGTIAIASRVQAAIDLVPHSAKDTSPATRQSTDDDTSSLHHDHDHHEQDSHLAVTVHGERAVRNERRAASDYFIHREIITAAPHADGADALRVVPGLTLGRGEGMGVAHSYSLRGFHAEHGQDIEFQVGGLPINLPSHIHGHGYADLNFLIDELVDEVSASEGLADPAQSDFAVAGSIAVGLGVDDEHRGLTLRSGYGSFGTFREALVWAPKEAERESVGAAQFTSTQGYGERRQARAGSALLQHRFGQGPTRFRAIGLVHIADGQSAGLVRKDDVDAGVICYRCVYQDPTAQAQSASNQRVMAGIFADYHGRAHSSGSIGAWVGYDQFTARSNATGYTLGTRSASGAQLSDMNEQKNGTASVGVTGRYQTEVFDWGEHTHATLEVGSDGRLDRINQSKDLVDAELRSSIWDQKVNAGITQTQLALWSEFDLHWSEHLNLRAGARASLLSYVIDDRAHSQLDLQDLASPQAAKSSETALFVGPRASAEYRATKSLRVLSSYGHGYRSPSALALAPDQNATFSTVRSGDLGLRYRPDEHVTMSATGYLSYISKDLIFDPHAGGLVEMGATRRAGGMLYAVLHPTDFLLGSLSITYVDARVLGDKHDEHDHEEEDMHEDEHHGHGGEPGDRVPGVAPLTMRVDAQIKQPLGQLGAHVLTGTASLGFTFQSPKPLGEGYFGEPWTLLDAAVGLLWGPLDLKLSGYNLLNRNYATEEYLSSSTWDRSGSTPASEAHLFAAGSPLSLMITLGLML